jgi:hypothetical protein
VHYQHVQHFLLLVVIRNLYDLGTTTNAINYTNAWQLVVPDDELWDLESKAILFQNSSMTNAKNITSSPHCSILRKDNITTDWKLSLVECGSALVMQYTVCEAIPSGNILPKDITSRELFKNLSFLQRLKKFDP